MFFRREIMSFVEAGMPREVLLYAAEQTAGKERPFGYLKKLLQELAVKRAYTMEEAKAALESRASQGYTRARTKPESLDYPQKRYTEEDLKHIFINLDEGM